MQHKVGPPPTPTMVELIPRTIWWSIFFVESLKYVYQPFSYNFRGKSVYIFLDSTLVVYRIFILFIVRNGLENLSIKYDRVTMFFLPQPVLYMIIGYIYSLFLSILLL